MKPTLIKVVITDDDHVMMDGKISPIGLMEEKALLQDPRYDVTISKHGLFRVGWQDRQGTPIGPQAPRPVNYDSLEHKMKVVARKLEVAQWHAKNPGKKMPTEKAAPEVKSAPKAFAPLPKPVKIDTGIPQVSTTDAAKAKADFERQFQPPAPEPQSVVKTPKVVPVTPHPITPNTPKVDKNPPNSVEPIPNFTT
jgi:hypothetical protein